jgi:hypothetical protein
MAARLRQLRVVVADVEPLCLPVLVVVVELIRHVLGNGIITHLDYGSSGYSRIICARLQLHPEELPEQDLVGLHPHEGYAEVHEDGDMVGLRMRYSTNRANIEISSGFFSIGYGSPVVVRHRSISFSRRNLLLTRARRIPMFNFVFFHSFARLGRGEEGGDDDD